MCLINSNFNCTTTYTCILLSSPHLMKHIKSNPSLTLVISIQELDFFNYFFLSCIISVAMRAIAHLILTLSFHSPCLEEACHHFFIHWHIFLLQCMQQQRCFIYCYQTSCIFQNKLEVLVVCKPSAKRKETANPLNICQNCLGFLVGII